MNSGNNKKSLGFHTKQQTKQKLKHLIAVSSAFCILLTMALFIYFNVSNKQQAFATAALGDYHSKVSGNWNLASTWERFNGTAWVPAPAAPTSLDGVITIQSPHIVTVTVPVLADQVIINAGGQITLNSGITFTLANGAGTDLDVSGIFKNAGTVTLSASATIVYQSTGKYQYNFTSGTGTIPTATWNAGSTCEIINTGSSSVPGGMAQMFSNFTWNCATQSGDVTLSGAPTTVSGTYSVISTATKKLRLASGNATLTAANFIQSGGDFTLSTSDNATTTINISNNFSMTGGAFSFGSGKNGFCNMNITGDWLQSAGTMTIEGEAWTSTITVSGNWSQTNGTFTGSNKNQISTITVNGNWSQAGGTFSSIDKDQLCTFNLYGDYSHTGGTIAEAGTGSTNIRFFFKDIGTQTFTASANTVTGDVDFTVNSGAILIMGNNILKGRNFTLSSGAELQIGSAAGITSSGLTGNIQVTGTRSFNAGASYTYNGAGIAQVTGNGLPITITNLTINNSSNVTLTSTVSVSSLLTFTLGKFITGALNELRVTNSAAGAITGYSSSNYIIGLLRRTVTGTGIYDFPVGNLSYSETATVTLAAATGFTTLLGSFTFGNPIVPAYPLTGIIVNGQSIDQMLNYGYWTLTPNSPMTGGTYSVTLKEQGQGPPNGGRIYCVLKRTNASSSWQSLGFHDNTTQSEIGGVVTAVRSALSSFSDFGIGYGEFLQFHHPVLISGTDLQANAIYLYSDVCTNVDAWIQILRFNKGASLADIDHFTDGYDAAWQPFINAVPNDTSSVTWLIRFKVADTARDTSLPYVAIAAIDVDGDGAYLKEFVEANNIYSYSLDPSTNLQVTHTSGGYRATSPVANVLNIDTAHHEAIFQINYRNLNNFTFTTGAISTYSAVETRQNCLFFHYFFNGNAALPVSLLNFNAKNNGDKVDISWSTAAEINNDYFTVERSADGKVFTDLERVKGSGNTNTVHKYSIIDENPLAGKSYYRLRQKDYNGNSELFRIVPVNRDENAITTTSFIIYPNPFHDSFTAELKTDNEEEIEITVINIQGTVLYSEKFMTEQGINKFYCNPSVPLKEGTYVVRVSDNKTVLASRKIVCR